MNELKFFKDYEELKKEIGATGQIGIYADSELDYFINCMGSTTNCSFELTIGEREYSVTVTSKEVENDVYEYEYEVFEISVF